ncbi:hypothetical protein [Campylobacter sp. 7477a]|uniref:hypothetical protein n=1 Tax=Campylobacter sp. 7477a TaxID=2735741 RepID=UPI0030145055|nr:hypothetical protein [Campylobacter sp. 7477a]
MAESHVLSALIAKHAELQGNINHYKVIISSLKSELEIINKAIAIFDPCYKTSSVPAKKSKISYFARGKLTKKCIECLKIKSSSIDEIMQFLFKDEKVDSVFIANYKQNIYALLSRLIKRNSISYFIDNGVKFYQIDKI